MVVGERRNGRLSRQPGAWASSHASAASGGRSAGSRSRACARASARSASNRAVSSCWNVCGRPAIRLRAARSATAGTQGAFRLYLRQNGEHGVTVSRRLGQVRVGQPALRHQRIEQHSIAIVRASDGSAPPLEAFAGQLPAQCAVRRPIQPAEQPCPCQTAGRQLGADFLRRPEHEPPRRDWMLRVQLETKAKVRPKSRPFCIGARVGEHRPSVRHGSTRSIQEVDLDRHGSTDRPAIRRSGRKSRLILAARPSSA